MSIFVGISGWKYAGWRGTFYPPTLPHHQELAFASHALTTIEINGTFYSLQRPRSYASWFAKTPDNFVFSVKANRYITHIKRLHEVEIPMANFLASGPLILGHKLGPFLWQLPPSLSFEQQRFEKFLELLPKTTLEAQKLAKKTQLPRELRAFHVFSHRKLRHAVEVRHDSFMNPWFIDMLKAHNVAVAFADSGGRWPYMEDLTSDFVYARLHGGSELYVGGYDKETLHFWADRIRKWTRGEEPEDRLTIAEGSAPHRKRDAYIYFDNDAKARAPRNAMTLIHQLKRNQEQPDW